jgi:hypothetical protein
MMLIAYDGGMQAEPSALAYIVKSSLYMLRLFQRDVLASEVMNEGSGGNIALLVVVKAHPVSEKCGQYGYIDGMLNYIVIHSSSAQHAAPFVLVFPDIIHNTLCNILDDILIDGLIPDIQIQGFRILDITKPAVLYINLIDPHTLEFFNKSFS